MSVKIKFGPSNEAVKSVADFATVRSAVENPALADFLGYDAANIDVRLNGLVITDLDVSLSDGDEIVISQRAQTKGC